MWHSCLCLQCNRGMCTQTEIIFLFSKLSSCEVWFHESYLWTANYHHNELLTVLSGFLHQWLTCFFASQKSKLEHEINTILKLLLRFVKQKNIKLSFIFAVQYLPKYLKLEENVIFSKDEKCCRSNFTQFSCRHVTANIIYINQSVMVNSLPWQNCATLFESCQVYSLHVLNIYHCFQ